MNEQPVPQRFDAHEADAVAPMGWVSQHPHPLADPRYRRARMTFDLWMMRLSTSSARPSRPPGTLSKGRLVADEAVAIYGRAVLQMVPALAILAFTRGLVSPLAGAFKFCKGPRPARMHTMSGAGVVPRPLTQGGVL
jgi:hypothetical protein